ncbi:AraC family transcriptional regulator, partial [Streptomyces sp. NPDC006553]
MPGVVEVFHAHFTAHAYPMHVHDVWTLLIV